MQLYAKQHKDAKLMVEIMKLLKRNDLPMQPGTADIVFRYLFIHIMYLLILVWLTMNDEKLYDHHVLQGMSNDHSYIRLYSDAMAPL